MAEPTPEEKIQKIRMVRLLIGDSESSVFYPMLSDEDIEMFLVLSGWNVLRAARQAAISAAFLLSTVSYRERTGDIEVWNNASIQYAKVLDAFIGDSGGVNGLSAHIRPYAAGISKEDVCASNMDRDKARSPLAQIRTCDEWWRYVPGYNLIGNGCNDGCGSGCRP